MKLLPHAARQMLRRHLGTVSIDDPRENAARAPYTYFLPSENELLALAPGDQVKIIVRSHPPSPEWDAERMWFLVTAASGDKLAGTLENQPSDIPQLRPGAALQFHRSDVTDIIWADDRSVPPPGMTPRREYWDRCLVDQCLLDGEMLVHYLYREEPDADTADDEYPDSGWRIRGDYRNVDDAELNDREVAYVALGAVLNRDDRWIHLIDAPTGSRFLRDWTSNRFEPLSDDELD